MLSYLAFGGRCIAYASEEVSRKMLDSDTSDKVFSGPRAEVFEATLDDSVCGQIAGHR